MIQVRRRPIPLRQGSALAKKAGGLDPQPISAPDHLQAWAVEEHQVGVGARTYQVIQRTLANV